MRKRFLLIFILLVSAGLISCVVMVDNTNSSTGSGRGTISGRVTDRTGAGVSGVLVKLRGAGREVRSGGGGHYIFKNVKPGSYDVSAKLGGFNDIVIRKVHVSAYKETVVDIRMTRKGKKY